MPECLRPWPLNRAALKAKPDAGEWREYMHDSGVSLPFRFVRSARKTLAIQIQRDASVVVRAPRRLALAEALLFLRERWAWIQAQRQMLLQNPLPTKPKLKHGEYIQHVGDAYRLQVQAGRRNHAERQGDVIQVFLRPEQLQDEAALLQTLARWQRREAELLFALRLQYCHARMQGLALPFPEMKIRRMRSRWGSCSRQAVITLNLELVQMPLACIDYVITHELCHLREFNHSPRFYALQTQYMPDWRERKQQLERLARELNAGQVA